MHTPTHPGPKENGCAPRKFFNIALLRKISAALPESITKTLQGRLGTKLPITPNILGRILQEQIQ